MYRFLPDCQRLFRNKNVIDGVTPSKIPGPGGIIEYMKRTVFFLTIFLVLLLGVIVLGWFGMSYLRQSFVPPIAYTTSSKTVIKELRALSRLETASFTIEKVIDAGTSGNTLQEFFLGDRLLLIAHGEVIAGFDLANLSENDVVIEGQAITLTLPTPTILITTLDNSQTRVYDRRRGLLNPGDKDLEANARVVAEKAITDAACQGKILDEATNNAKKQLTALLKAFGFASVTIHIPQGKC